MAQVRLGQDDEVTARRPATHPRSASLHAANPCVGTGAAEGMGVTFEQLDELLVPLGASAGRS